MGMLPFGPARAHTLGEPREGKRQETCCGSGACSNQQAKEGRRTAQEGPSPPSFSITAGIVRTVPLLSMMHGFLQPTVETASNNTESEQVCSSIVFCHAAAVKARTPHPILLGLPERNYRYL